MSLTVSPEIIAEYDKFDWSFYEEEQKLNNMGMFPGMNVLVGSFRLILGTVQVISSLAAACFFGIKSVYQENKDEYLYRRDRHIAMINQGFLNIGRALLELPILSILAAYHIGFDLNGFDPASFWICVWIESIFKMLILAASYDAHGYRIPYEGELRKKQAEHKATES